MCLSVFVRRVPFLMNQQKQRSNWHQSTKNKTHSSGSEDDVASFEAMKMFLFFEFSHTTDDCQFSRAFP